jgi:flagellar protein FlgJ
MISKIQASGNGNNGVPLPRLRQVCAEFEAVFLNHLLKTMRSSMTGGSLLGNSHQGEIMGSLMDEKLALDMAKKRGIGIGELLFQKLQASYRTSDSGGADE